MKALLRANKLSKDEQRIIERATRESLARDSKEFGIDFEAMTLYVLHKYYGFGKDRLLKFRKIFIKEATELRRFYEMEEAAYPARCKLREIGVDVEKLIEEDTNV